MILVLPDFLQVSLQIGVSRQILLAFGHLGVTHAPPGGIAVGHGLGQDLDVEEDGDVLYLLGILEGGHQLFHGADGVALAAVSLRHLGVVDVHEVAEQTVLIAIAQLGAQRNVAVANLQVVDAAEGGVVEQADVDLLVLLAGGDQLTVEHIEAAITAEGIDLVLVANGQLHAQSAGHLVAHGGIAVLHVVGVNAGGTPHPLHIAGQRAGGANGNVALAHHGIDGAQSGGLGQLGIDVLREALGGIGVGVIDLRLPALLVGEGDVIEAVQLIDPLLLGDLDLILIGGLIALQQLFQTPPPGGSVPPSEGFRSGT